MMVAAHRSDLDAARTCGLRTGFLYRPDEFGPAGRADQAIPGEFDVVANDFPELASQLGT